MVGHWLPFFLNKTFLLTSLYYHYQSYSQQASKLAGQIAFLKSYSTACGQDTARDAVQVFGGRGITQTGMGRFIEHVCISLAHHPSRHLLLTADMNSITGPFHLMHSLVVQKMS